MPWTDSDQRWMQRALELAARGTALASPNPMVGCVLVKTPETSIPKASPANAGRGADDSVLIGEGWHEYDLRNHAEIAALIAAGAASPATGALANCTAYVTLEPCNHTGRTGPCTEALIDAGVRRVVIATLDPNPLVAGKGVERLRQAGVVVEVGLLETEARRLNEGFACWIVTHKPLVIMKVAMTLDGRIAPPPGLHTPQQPYWITGEASHAAVQTLRWQADAALTGIDTVLADDPLLTDRSGRGRRRPLLRVVLDSALRIPLDAKIVTTAADDLAVFTIEPTTPGGQARIGALRQRGVRVEVLKAESGQPPLQVPLPLVLDTLGEWGILSLLTETGTRLNTALLAAGCVDRLHLFCSPQIMGSDALPAFKGLPTPAKFKNFSIERHGDDLEFCSLLRDPWARDAEISSSDSPTTDDASGTKRVK